MAKRPSEIRRIIKRYTNELARIGIRAERVMLYGSYAAGTANDDSDIDLFIISSDWDGFNQRERLEMLGIAAARILEPVQAQGFTPQEIANNQIPLFWEHVLQEQSVAI
ncbi:MAG: nucleotidyltransferase domain-containing protein [Chloroflexota bacterium]